MKRFLLHRILKCCILCQIIQCNIDISILRNNDLIRHAAISGKRCIFIAVIRKFDNIHCRCQYDLLFFIAFIKMIVQIFFCSRIFYICRAILHKCFPLFQTVRKYDCCILPSGSAKIFIAIHHFFGWDISIYNFISYACRSHRQDQRHYDLHRTFLFLHSLYLHTMMPADCSVRCTPTIRLSIRILQHRFYNGIHRFDLVYHRFMNER